MTVWILGTNDSFRSTGVQFGCAPGSVHNQYRTIIEVICELREAYIQWPSLEELAVIARNFEDRYGYPGVGGCVDGCHLRTTAPLEQPQRYLNRHHDYSVILQGICDHRLVFREVFLGQPGAVGDVRTFDRSAVGRRTLRQPDLLGEYHLLGDGAYTLTHKLLKPYRDLGNLTNRQKTHNYILSSCRSSIERAFALLKGKWRRLKYFHVYSMQYAIESMMSCIVLHNFILLEGVEYEDRYEYNGVHVPQNVTDEVLLEDSKARGSRKRDYIAALLHQE